MSYIERTESCCGVGEIQDLDSDPTSNLDTLLETRFVEDNKFPFYFFADNMRNLNGQKLADFLSKNKLGKVLQTTQKKNPNSGNKIRAWLFSPNDKSLRAYAKKNNIDIAKDTGW